MSVAQPTLADSEFDPISGSAMLERTGLAAFHHQLEVVSTMDWARALAIDPDVLLPAAVVADRQTLGRGRQGARWWQPPGSLAVSVVIDARSLGQAQPQPVWSLACGVAMAEALAALEPLTTPRVRWPNDVESRGRKLAGILVETAPDGRAIFGIGVNTTGTARGAPEAIRHRIATLPDTVGRTLPRETLLVEFLPRFFELLNEIQADASRLIARYRPLCSLTGEDVTVFRGAGKKISGRCCGIDTTGALVVDTVAGRLHLASGSLTDPAAVWRGDAQPDPQT